MFAVEYIALKKKMLYNLFLYLRIMRCETPYDIQKVFKNILFFGGGHKDVDYIIQTLTECIQMYPIPIEKIEYFSLLQQKYEMSHGIENYVTLVLWTSIIQVIIEHPKRLK